MGETFPLRDGCFGMGGEVGRGGFDAGGEFQELVGAGLGFLHCGDVGGGGAEQEDGFGEGCEAGGGVAGVVAGVRLGLLVGPLVFFVDDDQSEVAQGGEEGGAGADDDAALAGPHLAPLLAGFGGAQAGVAHGDLSGEAGLEAGDGLGRECDFGDQRDHGFAVGEGVGCGVEVDLGFAAAGDAVEEEGVGGGVGAVGVEAGFSGLGEGGADCGGGLVLGGGEGWGGRPSGVCGVRGRRVRRTPSVAPRHLPQDGGDFLLPRRLPQDGGDFFGRHHQVLRQQRLYVSAGCACLAAGFLLLGASLGQEVEQG